MERPVLLEAERFQQDLEQLVAGGLICYHSVMVDYTSILANLPPEMQSTLLKLVEAVEQNLREQLVAQRGEMLDVRALANGLLELQQASIQRLERLETVVLQLAEAQQRTEARLEQLAEAQQRTEARLEQLAEAQQRTEARMEQLAEALAQLTLSTDGLRRTVTIMQPRLAKVDGWHLEQKYVERAAGYFGRWLRQVDVLWPGRLDRAFEQQLDASLSPDEKDEVLRLDAIIRGKTQPPAAPDEVYIALEASVTVNTNDVDRVRERATLLRRLGLRVIPVVAGEMLEYAAEEAAKTSAVAILQDGKRQGWQEALAAA
jgi:hypothetical protein